MFGWMTVFALMFLLALWSTLASYPSGSTLSLKLATGTSGTLLLACAVTRVARGRV